MSEDKKQEKVSSKIIFSDEYLSLKIEEGDVYHGHITLESADKQTEIHGKIYSTNDKLMSDYEEFHGVKVDIPFYFKGKLSTSDTFFLGDFILVTNLGEYNIPFYVEVVKPKVSTSLGITNKLSYFAAIYEKDKAEAQKLFFSSSFSKVFLRENEELRHLYKSFQKGRKKPYILEEFMVSAGLKQPAAIDIFTENIVLDEGEETVSLLLKETGYLEGSIQSVKGQVEISADSFTSNDFKNEVFTFTVKEKDNQIIGSDIIKIVTPRQVFEVPVEWWGKTQEKNAEAEERRKLKKARIELMNDYLAFRTGNLGPEDFTSDALHILENLIFLTDDLEWKLYRSHIFILQNGVEQAVKILDEVEEETMEEAPPLLYNYFLYLKTLCTKKAEDIQRAVLSLREQYEDSEEKAEYLWMLLYVDREYVYNKRLQYDSIKQLFNAGCNSSLLYFEACDILNDNPSFMEEVGTFEIRVFRWGMRYGYISMALAQQFARSAQKVKFFKKSIFYTGIRLYEVEKDERFLMLICALLIKGNLTDQKYHEYFKLGVERNLKLIGLNEFYIRSMDFDQYEIIPQRVLLHFTYSSSLDAKERAYLYVNLLKNRENYDEIVDAYRGKMMPFIEEQLLRGNVNKQLAYLYRYVLPELLKKPEFSKAICDIMFQYEITCDNPNMIGIYVSCPELGKETYYPLLGGKARIEIYNERTMLYFVNRYDVRFHTGIHYEISSILDTEKIPREWIDENINNDKIVLMQSVNIDEIEEETLHLAKKIYSDEKYEPWIKERSIEALLVYYSNHGDMKHLKKWLYRTDYSRINHKFREKLMKYYFMADMIEHTYFGVELYGSDIIEPEYRLKLAEFGIDHCKGEKDEVTLSLCYDGIVTKHYSEKTLQYLLDHFEGEIFDYLMLWKRCRKNNLDTEVLEERILRQCIYTGKHTDGVANIFAHYYADNRNSDLILEYLQFMAGEEYTKENIPYHIKKIIGKEILSGRITSKKAKIRFLYDYAVFEDLQESEREVIVFIMKQLLKEKVYLPIYNHYSHLMELPVEYKENTFLTYLGETGQEVRFAFHFVSEEETEEITYNYRLEEVIPGRYVCALYFFKTDKVTYTLSVDGEVVEDETKYQFESFSYPEETSRFFVLNEICHSGYQTEMLEDYVKRSVIARDYVTLL